MTERQQKGEIDKVDIIHPCADNLQGEHTTVSFMTRKKTNRSRFACGRD